MTNKESCQKGEKIVQSVINEAIQEIAGKLNVSLQSTIHLDIPKLVSNTSPPNRIFKRPSVNQRIVEIETVQ